MEQRQIEFATIDIATIQPHPKNVRQGDIGAISESLKAHGQYRPIVVDRRTNKILAGNHTWRAAKSLGWSEIAVGFIESKDDDDAIRILLADNRTTDLASYDDAGLAELLKQLVNSDEGLEGTLYDGDALDQLIADIETNTDDSDLINRFTQKITVPQYEIVGEKPKVNELYKTDHSDKLRKRIEDSDIAEDIKTFLIEATKRHTVFDYRKIAEFYPHASAEVQQLMEDSALIIIDAGDAIAKGYAVFSQEISDIEDNDRDQ